MRKIRLWLLMLAVTQCVACRCGEKEPQSVLELVPARAPFALTISQLDSVSHSLDAFVGRFSRGLMEPVIARGRSWLVELLGFSPWEPKGWARLGIDAARGLAVFWEQGKPVLVLALAGEEADFEHWLARLAEARWNARPERIRAGGERLVEWRAADGRPVLREGRRGKFALLAGPAIEPERLASFLHLEKKEQLSAMPWPAGERGRMQFFFNAGELWAASWLTALIGSRATARLEIAADRLELDIFYEENGKQKIKLAPAPATASFADGLPPDMLVALRAQIPPATLLEGFQAASPQFAVDLRKWLDMAADYLGGKFRSGLYDNLNGSFLLLAGLGQAQRLSELVAAGVPRPDLVSASFWVMLLAGVRDRAALGEFIDDLTARAGERLPLSVQQADGLRVAQLAGEMGYRLQFFQQGGWVGACLGQDCLKQVGQLAHGHGAGIREGARELFAEPAIFSGYFHLGGLVAALQKAFSPSSLAERVVVDTLASVLGVESSAAFSLGHVPGYLFLRARVYFP